MMAASNLRAAFFLAAGLWLTACGQAMMNRPITSLPDPGDVRSGSITNEGYRLVNLADNGRSDEILLWLSFSGGGKRSSAFSYGVLEGLRDFQIQVDGEDKRLLDEVDVISSVSGGTFTAAYYGLYRDAIFDRFTDDFLNVDLDGYIAGTYLLPWNWAWVFSRGYGTNDRMAEVYDDLMFHGATFADMFANGLPLINIQATDIVYGNVFVFNQNYFDLICSDLLPFPLARAVAASNGFPVLFSPVTLEDYAEECRGVRPRWIEIAEQNPDQLARGRQAARPAENYLDADKTHYVHLADGGVADNLAMRGALGFVSAFGQQPEFIHLARLDRVRRILFVVVDGEAAQDDSWARQRTVSGIGQIIANVSGVQIDRYNYETLLMAREQLEDVVENVKSYRCAHPDPDASAPCDDVEGHLIHLSLSEIDDARVRAALQSIPTGLTLEPEQISLLVENGRQLALNNPVLQDLRDTFATPGPAGGRLAATDGMPSP